MSLGKFNASNSDIHMARTPLPKTLRSNFVPFLAALLLIGIFRHGFDSICSSCTRRLLNGNAWFTSSSVLATTVEVVHHLWNEHYSRGDNSENEGPEEKDADAQPSKVHKRLQQQQ